MEMVFPIVESNKYNSGYLFDTPYERIVPEKKKRKKRKMKDVAVDVGNAYVVVFLDVNIIMLK